jgi:hypothetical protein
MVSTNVSILLVIHWNFLVRAACGSLTERVNPGAVFSYQLVTVFEFGQPQKVASTSTV